MGVPVNGWLAVCHHMSQYVLPHVTRRTSYRPNTTVYVIADESPIISFFVVVSKRKERRSDSLVMRVLAQPPPSLVECAVWS
eukprot:m.14760 g.14760  ORF g.14760 m.14760 type:complete len:82 (+) comp3194_c0_seq1:126-371(+)